jgi:tRNA(Arg) A34 adenosine deaminase TadA
VSANSSAEGDEAVTLNAREETYLRRAIELSQQARSAGDQPFGALLVGANGEVIAEDVNTESTDDDITAHPELKLARWAAANLTADEATTTTMYTSCEACAMCSGAIVTSGLGRVVFALSAPQLYALKGSPGLKTMRGLAVLAQAERSIDVFGPFLYESAAAAHAGFWTEA